MKLRAYLPYLPFALLTLVFFGLAFTSPEFGAFAAAGPFADPSEVTRTAETEAAVDRAVDRKFDDLKTLFAEALAAAGAGSTKPAVFLKTIATDTITNTESDTLNVGLTMHGLFSECYHLTLNNLSGTRNLTAVLQESNVGTGTTDWVPIDTLTATGSTVGTYRQTVSECFGQRQRWVITGTGTQSTRYVLTHTAKRKNPE
jgi:hypothetical protein